MSCRAVPCRARSQLFDPRNPKLPYVYDEFEWAHCDWNPDLVPTTMPTFHEPGKGTVGTNTPNEFGDSSDRR